jgi:hypothetical protein
MRSERRAWLKLSFPAPFFGSFFGRAKNEQRIFGRPKKEREILGRVKNEQTILSFGFAELAFGSVPAPFLWFFLYSHSLFSTKKKYPVCS